MLLYLLARLLWSGFRPAERRQRLVPVIPLAWLALAIVVLVGFRVALNVVDSNVIDVGYAGVIGADRIADGKGIYGPGFSEDVPRGDTYGPVTYLAYLPFEQRCRGAARGTTCPPRTARRCCSTSRRWPGWCCWACACDAGGRGASWAWRWGSRGRRTRTRCSPCRPTPTTPCSGC